MKKLIPMMMLLAACYTHVEPGYVGVQIISCGDGSGVSPTPLGVGYHSTGTCTTIITYPTYTQSVIWTHKVDEGNPTNEEITFTNADQMSIAVDVSLAYTLDPGKVPAFYAKFRADSLKAFTDGFMRNMARDKFDRAAGKYRIEQIMGDNAEFLAEVRSALQKELDPYGVNITQFGVIGAPRPPQGVIDSINAKIAATQKAIQAENELRQTQAEAKKRVAEAEGAANAEIAKAKGAAEALRIRSEAEAAANKRLAESLTVTLVEYQRWLRWDGKMPQVAGGGTPIWNLGNR